MSDIQLKLNRHAKKQKYTTHNEEKNQSVETDPQIAHDRNLFKM